MHRAIALSLCLCAAGAVQSTPWQAAAPSPVAHFEGATAVVDGRLYAFGGFGPGPGLPSQSASHVYDPDTDQWRAIAPMPRAVTHVQAAVIGTRVYLGGGFEGASGGPPIAVVQVYDTLADQWSTTAVPDLPGPRASGGFVASGTRLHHLGGLRPGRCVDTAEHWVFDIANPATGWQVLAPMPETRNHFQAVVHRGRIHVTGGQRGHDCGSVLLRTNQVWDPDANRWSELAPLPFALSHHEPSVFVWNDQIVIGGGIAEGAGAIASALAYDIARDRWTRRPDLPSPRRSPIFQRIGARLIYGTGGALPNGITADATMFVNTVRADAPRVLFLRGADRSGGFLEATDDVGRTAQLADVDDVSTTVPNRGWGELRATLEAEGYVIEQLKEAAETASGPAQGQPVPLERLALGDYAAIVFGSNNARYGTAAVDAVDGFVRAGGGALFVSDANFGSDWSDAPSSDQAFLDRYDLRMNQDTGTYARSRAAGHFLLPDHPIFAGVEAFDGEGVSPLARLGLGLGPPPTILAAASGQTRDNLPPFGAQNLGPARAAGAGDAALVVHAVGLGRIAGHYDRNTFFNPGGAGTDITRLDNRRYAVNLFGWIAQRAADPAQLSNGFE